MEMAGKKTVAGGGPIGKGPLTAGAPFDLSRLFRWGWRLTLDDARWCLPALAVAVVVQILAQTNIQILSSLISGLGNPGPDSRLGMLAIEFGVASGILLALQFLDRFLSARTDLSMLGRLQERLHRAIHAVGLVFHEKQDSAKIQMTVLQYANGAQQCLREVASFPIVRTIGLGYALLCLWKSLSQAGESPVWVKILLFTALLGMPLVAWLTSSKSRMAFQEVQASQAALALALANSLQSPVEVRGMNIATRMAAKFRGVLDRHTSNRLKATLRNEILNQFQSAVPEILRISFLLVATWTMLHSNGRAQVGALLGVYYFVPMVVAPLREIITFSTGLQNSWPLIAGVLDLLELPDDPLEPKTGTELTGMSGEIAFKDVTFRYAPNASTVLDKLDIRFQAGKVTAIVARAGAGKSTILSLVSRLRAWESGSIRIAGQDLYGIAGPSLRKHVFKVSQFPLFLSDTVRENMLVANQNATDAQIESAARKTGLWEVLVTSAGEGNPLDHVLPRDASQGLSGGQRRLFALTRALLASPTILLLDEPTTGVDAIGRRNIARILEANFEGRTILLVDHDMQFVREMADIVVCLEQGRVAAQGSPEELIGGDNLFARLYAESSASPRSEEEVSHVPD
jgi:ATP-binding cassette, subfamily B, bacterial